MAEQATVVVTVAERNAEVGQTSNNRAKLGVKTGSGKWVQVTGAGVENIKVGHEIVINEPKQFGKQWFADLKEIKAAQAAHTNGAPLNGAAQQQRFDTPAPKITWDDFERTVRSVAAMINEFEPDTTAINDIAPQGGDSVQQFTVIDRSTARAAMFNTIVIALTKGTIEPAPKVPF